MDKAEEAYEAAKLKVVRARAGNTHRLNLSGGIYNALEELPPEIEQLSELQILVLSRTRIKSFDVLKSLKALRYIDLEDAEISDISWLGSVMNFVYLVWPMRVSDTVTH
ncbi:leucine-rich repeat domain-containing protein [Roseibaca sp. V10]|uniref:Leucine-rich repeat domain-containing protein n=1 Tax=Roseinatronobacter domitianus TaxID=2940293 RepID=A0ABT0M5Z5_9RHOB|nr:leucine-rich repeat domain-containing protein [Roseibaca domitiana]MCL1630275.1 leucine-rich repeat domain-containing protein [Roseibaca domitiana]